MDIQSFVLDNLFAFVSDVGAAFQLSNDAVSSLYDSLYSDTTGDLGWLAIALLFVPMVLWSVIKYAFGVLNFLVEQASVFVNQDVLPFWNALVTDVNNLVRWVENAATTVGNWISQRLQDLGNLWRNAWNEAQFIYDNGRALIHSLLTDTWNWLVNNVFPVIKSYLAPIQAAIDWLVRLFALAEAFLLQFVSNPVGYISTLATNVFNALIQPFRPLLDFLSWWINYGARTLVAFVDHPTDFILQVIETKFLPWLIDLIASNW